MGALPMLGALAIGAQRLLPLVQHVYTSWSLLSGNSAALRDVLELLALPIAEPPAVTAGNQAPFQSAITFDNVSFRYPSAERDAVRNLSLEILKGQHVGITGRSGSGKSTVVDLLMGLLEPTAGSLVIDGLRLDDGLRPAWQAQVAHVPQSIFLMDDTIAANIALGGSEDELEMGRIRAAAKLASIDDFVQNLPNGYNSTVGERGIMLSGGQRQRIGIARALYKNAGVLVLDEATSALDEKTEAEIMKAIGSLPGALTVFVVAHRASTLRLCDRLIEIDDGILAEASG
jgi:ATP-binding cassette subfamily B protein